LAINVGCAEGYFAVGLAMLLPQARVTLFDIDPI
jgi:16S rRNA G1207 methylase RsmC